MPMPSPTHVYHFTRIEHLSSIIANGLLSDTNAQGRTLIEIGDQAIKDRRRRRAVPGTPEGFVADYVPFYFAARSPMMYSIARGNVPNYSNGTDRLIYLVSTVQRMRMLDLELILTDRNAVLLHAAFHPMNQGHPPADFIDWELMKQRYWNDTPAEPDRKERRMAECLVHQAVPWPAFTQIAVKNQTLAAQVKEALGATLNVPVLVEPEWYF